MTKFKIGDFVLIKTHEKSSEINKEISKFKFIYQGPFEVQGTPHTNAYYLVYPESRKPLGVRNVVDLKYYVKRD